MKKLFYPLVIVILSAPLWAEDKTFTWTLPTTCVDGTVIGSDATCPPLTSIDIVCDNGKTYTAGGADTSLIAPSNDFPPGSYTCSGYAKNDGGTSDASNPVLFTVSFQVPGTLNDLSVDP